MKKILLTAAMIFSVTASAFTAEYTLFISDDSTRLSSARSYKIQLAQNEIEAFYANDKKVITAQLQSLVQEFRSQNQSAVSEMSDIAVIDAIYGAVIQENLEKSN